MRRRRGGHRSRMAVGRERVDDLHLRLDRETHGADLEVDAVVAALEDGLEIERGLTGLERGDGARTTSEIVGGVERPRAVGEDDVAGEEI